MVNSTNSNWSVVQIPYWPEGDEERSPSFPSSKVASMEVSYVHVVKQISELPFTAKSSNSGKMDFPRIP